MKYPKIQSVFKRDEKTHQFIDEYSLPEFEYLRNNTWIYTEKIDGTNIRVIWDTLFPQFRGKTDNAEIAPFLMEILQKLFPVEKFVKLYPRTLMILFGEGFGYKIQKKMGMKYNPNECDFILFDVFVAKNGYSTIELDKGYWLERHNIEDIAQKLGIKVVPIIGQGILDGAIDLVKQGFTSTFGDFNAEGIVLKPKCELFTRKGERIITKVKTKDFR